MLSGRISTWLGLSLMLALAFGCAYMQVQEDDEGHNPLKQIGMAEDGIALEIFFARFDYGDKEINGQLWNEVDEQQFSAELRRELAKNGLRAGIVGRELPAPLTSLVAQSELPAPGPDAAATKLENEPIVKKRLLQVRSGRRSELLASHVYDELPLLTCEEGQPRGRTYLQAQGLFAVRAYAEGDGRVRLRLLPELQHGQAKQQYVSEDGIFRPQAIRPARIFDELALEARLSPGQTLIITSVLDRRGSVGHYFLTEQPVAGKLQQKILMIRLAETRYDDLFARQMQEPESAKSAAQ